MQPASWEEAGSAQKKLHIRMERLSDKDDCLFPVGSGESSGSSDGFFFDRIEFVLRGRRFVLFRIVDGLLICDFAIAQFG